MIRCSSFTETGSQFGKAPVGDSRTKKHYASGSIDQSTDFSLRTPGHPANGKDESHQPPAQHMKHVQPEAESSFLSSILPSS